jgi:hypothetical protein
LHVLLPNSRNNTIIIESACQEFQQIGVRFFPVEEQVKSSKLYSIVELRMKENYYKS